MLVLVLVLEVVLVESAVVMMDPSRCCFVHLCLGK